MDYMGTKFGVDSSSCFPFRLRTYTYTDPPTHKVTDATDQWSPYHWHGQLQRPK